MTGERRAGDESSVSDDPVAGDARTDDCATGVSRPVADPPRPSDARAESPAESSASDAAARSDAVAPPDPADGEWETLARHDWEASTELDVTLATAFDRRLDLSLPRYPEIDAEAISRVLSRVHRMGGDAFVRVDVGGARVVVCSDGTIELCAGADGAPSGDSR